MSTLSEIQDTAFQAEIDAFDHPTDDAALDLSVERLRWWVTQWRAGLHVLDHLGCWGPVSTERACPGIRALPNILDVWRAGSEGR